MSKWLNWKPTKSIGKPAGYGPTKPTELSFEGFEASMAAKFPIMRGDTPPMPSGVSLIEWNLKNPPVAIETATVVTNPALFAKSTLEQLRIALANPKQWIGWSVPQLIDRLMQVGVTVTLTSSELPERGRSSKATWAGIPIRPKWEANASCRHFQGGRLHS